MPFARVRRWTQGRHVGQAELMAAEIDDPTLQTRATTLCLALAEAMRA